MNEKTFEEKMNELKNMHAGSHPDAINMLEHWEERYARLKAQTEWLSHPNTQELYKLAIEQIKTIDNILIEKEDLSDTERRQLYAEKKAHRVYVAVLSTNPQSEMKSIESSVDEELTNN